jgi:hypothetical protein
MACYEIEKESMLPVHGSAGLIAMGQVNSEGNRLYDYFYGTFRLCPTDAHPNAPTFADNYEMDFGADETNIFSSEPFISVSD